ncbi:uncharacterized protein EDB91DRAFT_1242676 [Suillus paluster]|uniref:uncharacterized protein n=1 Tax=Suillus paluster TaxID=48578 RepID=UPI001B85E7E9|nr:uncharacterized protein EDB91DRAFT_1242676 [Suillus paluster]KAG1753703.1 hypothetical protein EDB91DRAFT_1242676 [Suillus paluster]
MPSQPADTALAHRTHASNATAHPGAILLQVKKPQCTTEEVAAAREEKAAQAATAKAGSKCIAVGSRPIPSKDKKAVKDGLSQTAACGGGDEVGTNLNQEPEILTQTADALMDLDNDQDTRSELGTFKKKITKALMKGAVNQVAHAHKKGNSLDVIVKMSECALSSKVNNWVSGVNIPIKNQNVPSHVTHTSASPPPSTIFSRLMSSSKTAHSEILTDIPEVAQCSGVDEDALGGFANDKDEDEADELECLAGYGITAKEGRSAATFKDGSDDELEIPAEFCAPFTQPSEGGLSKASFAVSNLKRKASEDLDITPGSEIEDFSDNAINNTMDIDLPDKSNLMHEVKFEKPSVKLEKPPCTTSLTSVATTNIKPALTKKAKVESVKFSTSLGATSAKPKEQQSVKVDTPHDNLKPQLQYQNTNLPEQVQADHHWAKKFFLTMMLWASSQESLWSIPDATLLTHIQIIFQAVYLELNLTIVQNGVVFSLTVQRLSEWQSNFSSTAIVIIFDFLTSNNDCDPEVLAGLLLKNFAFIFEDTDKCKPDGAFRSAFMLQLLGKAHLSAINGHAIIPALKTKDLASKGMASVIAFCATALKCTVTLISEGNIKVENVLASTPSCSKLNIKLPKVLNKATGKETSAPYLFSCDLWGKPNTGYMKSIKKKGLGFIKTTVDMARSALNESTTMDAGVSESSDNDCAFLCMCDTILLCLLFHLNFLLLFLLPC